MTDNQPIPPIPSHPANDAPPTGAPEVKAPPSHSCYKITCDKKRDGWDYAKLVAEFIGLGFLIAYTLYTAGIYCANRKAAEAAKSAAEVARDAFVVGQRPCGKI